MKFQVYPDNAGEYRWRLIARNGRQLADSGEGYKRRDRCVRSIVRFSGGVLTAATGQIEFLPKAEPTRRKRGTR